MRKLSPLIFAFLAVGFGETVAQVLLIRELVINFQGNELSLGVIFGNWLFLIAMGSWGLGRLADRLPAKAPIFAITLVLFSLILPVQLLLARTINSLLNIEPGEIVGLLTVLYSSLVVLLPLCLLNGFQFAFGCRILSEGEKTPALQVGKVYISEAVGCMAGGAIFTYLLVHYLHPFEIVVFTGLLNLASACLLLKPWTLAWKTGKDVMFKFLVFVVVFASAFGIFSLFSGAADTLHEVSRRQQWRGHNLVYHRDSVYGNITVTQSDGQFNFYTSGLLTYVAPTPDIAFTEDMAHFPMLHHPSPQKVLLIGGGVGGVLDEILKHPVTEVVYVELDPLMVQASRTYSPTGALDDPRVKVEHTDGRLYVRYTQEKYDVVIVNLPPPSTLQLNRVYTQEFFREVYNILNPDGIFSLGFPSSETYMTREMIRHNKHLYETTKAVFPNVSMVPGDWSVLIASKETTPAVGSADSIRYRFQDRNLKTSLFTVPYIEYKLSPERVEHLSMPLRDGTPVEINRDLQPIGTFYNLALWNVMFYPGSTGLFHWVSTIKLWWFSIPLGLLLIVPLFTRWRRMPAQPMNLPVTVAIMTTGFAGMTFSLVLLFSLQTLHGYLYQKIGIIIAAFMLGLASGGLSMNSIMNGLRRDVLALSKVELAILAYSFLLPAVLTLLFINSGPVPTIPVELLLSFLNFGAGFLVGLEFPLANKILLGSKDSVSRGAGTLYASDLLGAIFGALLASALLIPILGIMRTCLMVAMTKMTSLLLLYHLDHCLRHPKGKTF